jgi:ABC-2 type transport system permease protein
MILWFYFSFLLSTLAFWIYDTWGPRFLTNVILEFLSGGVFPLDILPVQIFKVLSFLPFPYLIFFPAKIYLGQLQANEVIFAITILIFWIFISFFLLKFAWLKGLRAYNAEGR